MAGIRIKPKKNAQVVMIAFKYNPDIVTKVKAIKGARYNNTERYWTIPYSENYRDISNSSFAGDSIVTVENSSKKDRHTPFSQKLMDLLKEYTITYKPKVFLFEGKSVGRYSKQSIQKIFKRALKKSGIMKKATVHTLRHSLSYFQEILGHSSSKTTEIYTHVSNTMIGNIKSPLDGIL